MDTPRKRRGRPCRVIGARSAHRAEVRLTAAEFSYLTRLAATNDIAVADLLRCGVHAFARACASEQPPIAVAGELTLFGPPPVLHRRRRD